MCVVWITKQGIGVLQYTYCNSFHLMAEQNQQPQNGAAPQNNGSSRGIIRTMQQDLDQTQGRGGDAFEEIASSSPLPPQAPAPQQNPDDILGMDMTPPSNQPQPMPPAPQPAPLTNPSTPAPSQQEAPAQQQLSDEELDALLPLDGAPQKPASSSTPSIPQPAPSAPQQGADEPAMQDYGSVVRRMPQQQPSAPTPEASTPSAPQNVRPMDDIASDSPAQPHPSAASGAGTPPPNLPTGTGPDISPSTPSVPAAPSPSQPQPIPPAPQPQPVPPAPQPATPQSQPQPFAPAPSAGLEEGEEVPGQTPEQLLGLDSAPEAAPQKEVAAPSAEAQPAFVEEKSSPLSSRSLVLVAGILFVAALVGTLSYFLFFSTGEPEPLPQPTTPPPAQEEVFIPPSPIVTPDEVDELLIADSTRQALVTGLQSLKTRDIEPGAIVYVPVRLNEMTDTGLPQYLTTQLFFETLGVALPEEFLSTVNSTFMLYLYGAGEEEELACTQNGEGSATCPGPRIGIALTVRPSAEIEPAALLDLWMQEDMSTFEPLILDEATVPAAPVFQEAPYASAQAQSQGALPVYYINLPHSATALNFALGPNAAIVVGTSKNSLNTMLDALIAEN